MLVLFCTKWADISRRWGCRTKGINKEKNYVQHILDSENKTYPEKGLWKTKIHTYISTMPLNLMSAFQRLNFPMNLKYLHGIY